MLVNAYFKLIITNEHLLMKRPCQGYSDTQGDDYSSMVSSPETSSGQAIWQKLKIKNI